MPTRIRKQEIFDSLQLIIELQQDEKRDGISRPDLINKKVALLKEFNSNLPHHMESKMYHQDEECDHLCSGNCRREGCRCLCGEWHIEEAEIPTQEEIDH